MQHYKQYSFTHVPCSCTAETEINLLKLNETLKKKTQKNSHAHKSCKNLQLERQDKITPTNETQKAIFHPLPAE